MTTSRRNFLKLFGFTVGVATAGGTIGGTILASPNEPQNPDEYQAKQREIFSQIYGDGGTIEDEINAAITEAQQAPPVEAKYVEEVASRTRGNDLDAFIPEMWAQESLALLEENMVIASLIHRDFNNQTAQYGDVVNTRRPRAFPITRKHDDDPVCRMDAMEINNIAVPLKNQFYCKFTIRDGEQSMSYNDLVAVHMAPAMAAIARAMDLSVYEEMVAAPALNRLSASSAVNGCIDARYALNDAKCYPDNRSIILTPEMDVELCRRGILGGNEPKVVGFNHATDASIPTSVAFHREAATLITRPMQLPLAFSGLRAAAAHYNDLSVRVTMSYNAAYAGTDVTIDTLCGVAVLEPRHICLIEPVLTTEDWMKLYKEDPTKLGLFARPRK